MAAVDLLPRRVVDVPAVVVVIPEPATPSRAWQTAAEVSGAVCLLALILAVVVV